VCGRVRSDLREHTLLWRAEEIAAHLHGRMAEHKQVSTRSGTDSALVRRAIGVVRDQVGKDLGALFGDQPRRVDFFQATTEVFHALTIWTRKQIIVGLLPFNALDQ
jgi:hypothetical protein